MGNQTTDKNAGELLTEAVKSIRDQMGNRHTLLAYFNSAALVPIIFVCGSVWSQHNEQRERIKVLESLMDSRSAALASTTNVTSTITVELRILQDEVRRLRERLENPVRR